MATWLPEVLCVCDKALKEDNLKADLIPDFRLHPKASCCGWHGMTWQRRCGACTRDCGKCILQSTALVTYFLTRPCLLKNPRPPKDHHHHYTQRPWALNRSVIPLSVRSGTSGHCKSCCTEIYDSSTWAFEGHLRSQL